MNKYLETFPINRLRRTRQSEWIRSLVSENLLSSNDLIWPVFLCEGANIKDEIKTMPGVFRYSIDRLSEVIDITSETDKQLPGQQGLPAGKIRLEDAQQQLELRESDAEVFVP